MDRCHAISRKVNNRIHINIRERQEVQPFCAMTRRLDDETSMPDRVDSDVIERNVLLEEITRLVKSPYPSQLHVSGDNIQK